MRLIFIVIVLLLLQIGTSLLIVSPEYSQQQILKEYKMLQQKIGVISANKVRRRADQWLDSVLYIESGIEFRVKRQTRVMGLLLYQFLLRVSVFVFWSPLIGLILCACIIDGLVRRKVGAKAFTYSAAERYRMSMRIGMFLLVVFVLLNFSPFGISPEILPILGLCFGGTLMMMISYSKKAL